MLFDLNIVERLQDKLPINKTKKEHFKMPNTVPNDYNPYAGCHKYQQLMEENKKLKEQLDTLDQECASRMNKEQEREQEAIIQKLCDVIRGLVPDPHADALIDEVYGENE